MSDKGRFSGRFVEVELVLSSQGDGRSAGRQTEVVEVLANGARLSERGDDGDPRSLEGAATSIAFRHVKPEHPAQESGPLRLPRIGPSHPYPRPQGQRS